jgi:hypothetical protein
MQIQIRDLVRPGPGPGMEKIASGLNNHSLSATLLKIFTDENSRFLVQNALPIFHFLGFTKGFPRFIRNRSHQRWKENLISSYYDFFFFN